MSLLDTASLIVTPNGYKEGKLYSVIPSDGSGDLSVTRATTATRVNSAGLVELVPYNLLRYSEQFNNAAWIQTGSFITANTATAPDGTLTADTYSAAQSNELWQTITVSTSTTYTISLWVKLGTATNLCLVVNNALAWNTIGGESFDSSDGLNTSTWTRISYTFTTPSTLPVAGGVINFHIGGNAETGLTQSTGTVFIWGAQLVEGSVAKDYQKTETRLNIPRLDYSNGTCPSLLVEPQRTNVAFPSEDFSGYSGGAATIVTNQGISPDGTQNADLIYPAINANFAGKYKAISPSTSGVVSCFVKQSGKRYAIIGTDNNGTYTCIFDLQTETVVYQATNYTAKIESVGNGWYRISAVYTSSTAAGYPFIGVADNSSGGVVVDGTNGLYIWGFQYELNSSYATSYIPTQGSTVTRNADVISKTGIADLIGQTEGTLYLEAKFVNVNSFSSYFGVTSGAFANSVIIGKEAGVSPNKMIFYIAANGTTILYDVSTALSSDYVKCAIAYKSGNYAAYINGTLVASGTTSFSFSSSLDRFGIGESDGAFSQTFDKSEIKSAVIYKTRLANAELASLTTI